MSKVKELLDKFEEGEISLVDATIELREIKKSNEKEIESIKNFEKENLNGYEEFKGQPYKGYEFIVTGGGQVFSYKGVEEIETLQEKYKSAYKGAMNGTVQTTTDEDGNKFWIDSDGEVKPFCNMTHRSQYLRITKSKKK